MCGILRITRTSYGASAFYLRGFTNKISRKIRPATGAVKISRISCHDQTSLGKPKTRQKRAGCALKMPVRARGHGMARHPPARGTRPSSHFASGGVTRHKRAGFAVEKFKCRSEHGGPICRVLALMRRSSNFTCADVAFHSTRTSTLHRAPVGQGPRTSGFAVGA